MTKVTADYMLCIKYTIQSIVCEASCHQVIQVIWDLGHTGHTGHSGHLGHWIHSGHFNIANKQTF